MMTIEDIDLKVDELIHDVLALHVEVRDLRDTVKSGTEEKTWLRNCGNRLEEALKNLRDIAQWETDDLQLEDEE